MRYLKYISILFLSLFLVACKSNKNNNTSQTSSEKQVIKEVSLPDDVKELLQNFGNNFFNYSSINERNESVKKYLTSEAIKKNGIDGETTAEFEAEGEITNIYQDVSTKNAYLIFATEKTASTNSQVVVQVTVDQDKLKISNLSIYYVKPAY